MKINEQKHQVTGEYHKRQKHTAEDRAMTKKRDEKEKHSKDKQLNRREGVSVKMMKCNREKKNRWRHRR